MNMRAWVRQAWQGLGADSDFEAGVGRWAGALDGGYGGARAVLRGLTGRSMEMAEAQAEVAAEARGQVLLIGRDDAANRGCLAHLRNMPPVPAAGPVYSEGFFTLVSLPGRAPAEDGAAAGGWLLDDWLGLVREADLLLYVFDEAAGWCAADAHWYARLRATGVPLVLVAAWRGAGARDIPPNPLPGREGENDCPFPAREGGQGVGCSSDWEGTDGRVALPAGCVPVRVDLTAPDAGADALPADVMDLVTHILAQRPRLGIPLAQEVPGCRALVARRAIHTGMAMTALLGAEPIPLLDLPLQVSLNWKLALQLAATYGHPGLDYRSRELLGAVAWNLGLRYLIQQVSKLVPVLGWGVSAALSAGGTWLFGSALVQYYQHEAQGAGDRGQVIGARWQAAWTGVKVKRVEAQRAAQGLAGRWRQAATARYGGIRGRLAGGVALPGRWPRQQSQGSRDRMNV